MSEEKTMTLVVNVFHHKTLKELNRINLKLSIFQIGSLLSMNIVKCQNKQNTKRKVVFLFRYVTNLGQVPTVLSTTLLPCYTPFTLRHTTSGNLGRTTLS